MNNIIRLILGDPCGDGHGRSATYVIKSNLTKEEIIKAYDGGVSKIGVDLINNVCSEYNESHVEECVIEKLMNFGYKHSLYVNKNNEYYVNINDFVNMFLFIVSIGDPGFKFSMIKDDTQTINIGGYGLFCS